jgi:hypothetical protein
MHQRLIILVGYPLNKKAAGEPVAIYVGPSMEKAVQLLEEADPGRWSRVELYRKPPIFRKRILS